MVECSFSEDAKMDVVLFPEHITELIAEDLIVKPYLRPMSSMTEEEKLEYVIAWDSRQPYLPTEAMDWLNEYHFDYRDLIEKGLALEAPEGMYKTE